MEHPYHRVYSRDELTIVPHQRAQTGMSTKTGVRGLAFSKDWRLAAATASVGQALPLILIGLSRALGGSMCVIIFLVEVLLIEKDTTDQSEMYGDSSAACMLRIFLLVRGMVTRVDVSHLP